MTGFPWIDAIMRQLRSEGWIHDLARRAVGSFLTRGCLWINWEEGFKVSCTHCRFTGIPIHSKNFRVEEATSTRNSIFV